MAAPSDKRQQPKNHDAPNPKRLRLEGPSEGALINMIQSQNGTSLSDRICEPCRSIPFEAIFNLTDYGPQWSWRNCLGPSDPQSECPLCRFFYQARVSYGAPEYATYVFHGRSAKGLLSAKNIEIDDSPAFFVAPRNMAIGPSHKHWPGIIMPVAESDNGLLPRRLPAKVDIRLLTEWLAFCDGHHKACAQREPPVPPLFRVIDCLADPKRAVAWEDIAHPKRYVTLSYVWGGDQGEDETADGTLPCPLPRTIDDAISLTIRLGYKYLWVDRYCIPRDDARAKHLQIQSMDVIYQHSALTFIAAAGENPHHGLPGVGETPRKAQPSITIGSRTLVWVPYIEHEILQSKWNSRGWTYQEGLLARRRLVFTDTQVYFQCQAMHCLESIQAPLEPLHTQNKARMRDAVDMSRVFPHRTVGKDPDMLDDRINEYLERSLTFERDILNAFRGVLAVYERRFSASRKTLAGIPIPMDVAGTSALNSLAHGLAWSWGCIPYKALAMRTIERRPGFPSWTWLGWKVPKPLRFSNGSCRRTVLVDAAVGYSDGPLLSWTDHQDLIFSRERAGSLPAFFRLRGPTLDVHISTEGLLTDEFGNPQADKDAQSYNGVSWRDIVACTRHTYAVPATPDSPVPFTLLALGFSKIHEIVLLVLYKPQAIPCTLSASGLWDTRNGASNPSLESTFVERSTAGRKGTSG